MSPGKERDLFKLLLAKTSRVEYEDPCRLDLLGLKDPAMGDQEQIYNEFKEQLQRTSEGWYQTGLPWKENHLPQSNEGGSLQRLHTLLRKLERSNTLERYNEVMRQQSEERIVVLFEVLLWGRSFTSHTSQS